MKGLFFDQNNVRITSVFLLSIVVFLVVLNFNMSHLTNVFTYDCINYAKNIEKSNMMEIYSPHHLLYNYLKWEVYNILKSRGYEGRALLVSQAFNAVVGALAVAILFLTVYFIAKDIFAALISTVITTFSFGWWYCSVFGGVRTLGMVFLILLFQA